MLILCPLAAIGNDETLNKLLIQEINTSNDYQDRVNAAELLWIRNPNIWTMMAVNDAEEGKNTDYLFFFGMND